MLATCSVVLQGADLPAAHFEPQVAMLCETKSDQPYRSQYMTEAGHWATDLVHKVTCYKDKLDILEYCKKVRDKMTFLDSVFLSRCSRSPTQLKGNSATVLFVKPTAWI